MISTLRQYGNGQRVGFVLVSVGFALCFAGCVSPYWFSAKTSVKDFSAIANELVDQFLGDVTLFEVHVGIWLYCVDGAFIDEKCYSIYNSNSNPEFFDDEDRPNWINFVRAFVSFNILLSFIAMCVACCRGMCCTGGRTVCHGILSFLAGGCGFCAFIITIEKMKSLLNIPIINTEYDWAFTVYIIGSVMLVVASFLLCCGVPRETHLGMVVAPPMPAAGVNISMSNSNTNNMVNQYNANGPINNFEPLPMPPPQYSSQPPHYNRV